MSSGKQLALVAGIILSVTFFPASINLIVDPYQWFRSSSDGLQVLHSNPRNQVAGLIKHHLSNPSSGFDTVIIGTSMGQNFVPSEVSSALGCGKVMKLNMPAAEGQVQLFVLEKALETGNIRRVIWEIGPYYLPTQTVRLEDIPTFPAHLYGNEMGDLRRTIFSPDMFEDAFDLFYETPEVSEYDGWNSWYESEKWDAQRSEQLLVRLPGHLEMIREFRDGEPLLMKQLLGAFTDREYPLLDRVSEVVRANPEVRFDFFFPPISAISYADEELFGISILDQNDLARFFFIQSETVRRLSEHSNAGIHGFDTQRDIVLDLRNYKDLYHYGPHVNQIMIDSMADGRSLLTPENIDTYQKGRLEILNEVVLEVVSGKDPPTD